MTRKISRYKDKEYVYYFCPTGKKHGCAAAPMVKETDLISCVQDSLRCQIRNVASLESILSSISQEKINQELVREYQEQIVNCEKQIKQVDVYKTKLYESLVNGCLTKDEYMEYKNRGVY